MAKIQRLWMALALVATSAVATAVPRVLVVQSMAPIAKEGDPNVPIANVLCQEIEDGGKLTAVAWSVSDPVFRNAVFSGRLKNLPDSPGLDDALATAKILEADYLLIVEAKKSGKNVKATATLFRGGKEIWKDSENMGASLSGVSDNWAGSAQSVARTICLKMGSTALKDLKVQQQAPTPEPAKGQLPVVTPAAPLVTPKSDNTKVRQDVEALIKENRYGSATSLLRDSIDVDPFDPERRSMLIKILMERDPAAAADEAHRAGAMLPEGTEFRVLAARAYMRAGLRDKAQDELNEAVARDPENSGTRLLLAELAIQSNSPEKALGHLDDVIKKEPTPEAFFLRAVCRAELGGADGVKLDLQSVQKLSPEVSPLDIERRFTLVARVLDSLISRDFDSIRDLTQRAIVKPKSPEVQDGLENLQRLTSARISLLEGIAVPPKVQKGYDRWLLAHKLLSQTLLDLRSYCAGSADSLVDARMNLGEAINQARAARDLSIPK